MLDQQRLVKLRGWVFLIAAAVVLFAYLWSHQR